MRKPTVACSVNVSFHDDGDSPIIFFMCAGFIEIQFMYHKIHPLKYTIQWFLVYSELCHHYHYQFLYFITS